MLESLIAQSRVLAGYLVDGPSIALIHGLDSFANVLPLRASPLDRLLIRGLVGHVLGRVLYSTGLGDRPEIAKAFMQWAASNATSDRWRSDLVGLIRCCTVALREVASSPSPLPEGARVEFAVRLMTARFNDPSLTRQAVAAEMKLSVWHASRLLKSQTGVSLFGHIHNRRVEAAEHLLRQGRLSVKEIAVAVGYGGARQLDRHFRRLRGMTPGEYRRCGRLRKPPRRTN